MTVVEETYKPDTWDKAAAAVVFQIFRFNLAAMNSLQDMRTQLDYMISRNVGISPDAWMAPDEMSDFWKILAAVTRSAAGNSGIEFYGINPERALEPRKMKRMVNNIAGLVTRKQRDYGSDNILRFGRLGLLVRVHDKIARLENLAARGTEPNNESISDNYMDVIGYCTVAIMFEHGWFTLPLEEAQ
jgi:hypothetical protein